jgi:hypothetical protein
VLICRCAWHQRYCGYPLLNGVASWRGWTLRFTDGICEKCLERFRAEHRSYLERRRAGHCMGGPEMAPQAPQRSERPGEAGALLDTPAA